MPLNKNCITVAYATPKKQVEIPVMVEKNCTIALAIARSKILAQFPEIKLSDNKVGINSRLATLDALVKQGDRVEIYRPLTMDPKELRRRKAKNLQKFPL